MKKLYRGLAVTLLCAAFLIGVRPTDAYEEGAVSGGGTIKGKVTFHGEIPMRKVIPTKDMEVCGGIREDPLITMGSGNGVTDAVVYLKDIQKGKKWAKPAKAPVLDNHNCRFHPPVQVIPVGMNVAIHNSDPVLHNTHGFLIKSTMFNVAMPKQGMQVERPLNRPGIIRVECDSHGWMRGWIYVADNPYYAMTGKDGTFTISDVPPGTYTLVIWQEYMGSKEMPVTVKPKETVNVPFEIPK
ncbi:MAG TPA: hypothetical protein VEP69_05370 [Thermodesulfovibrionales bacterium]|nr:hypothetical protein [Thermodesulfovibrionales bacterium]